MKTEVVLSLLLFALKRNRQRSHVRFILACVKSVGYDGSGFVQLLYVCYIYTFLVCFFSVNGKDTGTQPESTRWHNTVTDM